MNIGITVATQEEFDSLLPLIEYPFNFEYSKKKFVSGGFHRKHHIVLGLSGIGKVNAGITTSAMIDHFHPDLVINTGCAGADHKDIKIGSIVNGVRYRYHDVDCRLDDSIKYGQIPGSSYKFLFGLGPTQFDISKLEQSLDKVNKNMYIGTIYTGDSFTETKPDCIEKQFSDPGYHVYDMECAAVAQVCEMYKVPFASYKIISNNYLQLDQKKQFHLFWNRLSIELLDFTKLYLDCISEKF